MSYLTFEGYSENDDIRVSNGFEFKEEDNLDSEMRLVYDEDEVIAIYSATETEEGDVVVALECGDFNGINEMVDEADRVGFVYYVINSIVPSTKTTSSGTVFYYYDGKNIYNNWNDTIWQIRRK